jgi:hypothetical protein
MRMNLLLAQSRHEQHVGSLQSHFGIGFVFGTGIGTGFGIGIGIFLENSAHWRTAKDISGREF